MQYEKMFEIRESIVKPCALCKGEGSTISIRDGVRWAVECTCQKKFNRYMGYAKAGIAREYWDLTIDDFTGNDIVKAKVNQFIADIEKVKQDGLGITFCGPNGTGKTLSSILILKAAYAKKYSIRFTTMSELLNTIRSSFSYEHENDEEKLQYLEEVRESTFLVLDNMGSEYKASNNPEFVVANLDYVLRDRMTNLLPTFFTTNYSEGDFKETYGASIESLLSNRNLCLAMQGGDCRKKNQVPKDWGSV